MGFTKLLNRSSERIIGVWGGDYKAFKLVKWEKTPNGKLVRRLVPIDLGERGRKGGGSEVIIHRTTGIGSEGGRSGRMLRMLGC